MINVVSVVTMMIIGVNIRTHDTCNKLCIHISKTSVEKNAPPPPHPFAQPPFTLQSTNIYEACKEREVHAWQHCFILKVWCRVQRVGTFKFLI
jgi:hypothetical protein